MANWAVINPGLYHYGFTYPDPPYQNRRYVEELEPFKNVQFKTSVLHNRRIYIGNVKVTYADSTVEILGDTIFRSEVGQFDKFTKRGRIDVAVGDGEKIIKLETYADRILEFKDKTLHIINAAGQSEFLEDSFKYKGVASPQSVARTDYGIAWANPFGVYIYDGREIHDLLEDHVKRKLLKSNWDSFYNNSTMVGYSPSKRQIIVVDSYETAKSSGNILLYDLPTKSWVKGNARADAGNKSNFIIKHSDDRTTSELVYAKNTNSEADLVLEKWSDSPAVGVIDLQLKDEDFGQPHVRKKIYKIYVTAKKGSGISISAATNGSGDFSDITFVDTNSDGNPNIALNNDASWYKNEFKVASGGNNIYSIQLKFSGTAASADFEINDVSIVYRAKSIK